MHLSDRLATDGDTIFDDQLGLTESESISLYGIGVVYLTYSQTLLELTEFSYGKWSHRLYLLYESVYLSEELSEWRHFHRHII